MIINKRGRLGYILYYVRFYYSMTTLLETMKLRVEEVCVRMCVHDIKASTDLCPHFVFKSEKTFIQHLFGIITFSPRATTILCSASASVRSVHDPTAGFMQLVPKHNLHKGSSDDLIPLF
jgi:hypothetical protein